MIQQGKVISKENGKLQVCFQRPEMCAHCNMCTTGRKENGTVISLAGEANPGDIVEVDLKEQQLLRHTAAAYLIPLAGLILGLLLGTFLHFPEIFQALSALAMTAASFLAVRIIDRKLVNKSDALPKLVRVIPPQMPDE